MVDRLYGDISEEERIVVSITTVFETVIAPDAFHRISGYIRVYKLRLPIKIPLLLFSMSSETMGIDVCAKKAKS
jgi:hypothetical protein